MEKNMDKLSMDSVLALSIVDELEAKVRDGEPSAANDIRDLITGILQMDGGQHFVLQGIKAMLVWMQQETVPESYDDETELRHVWSLLNANANNDHRQVFNQFREELYCEADKLRDKLRLASITSGRVPEEKVPEEIGTLIEKINSIPVLR